MAIVVFAYEFPHRKTNDFLFELASAGVTDVHVIAAPWRLVTAVSKGFETALRFAKPHPTEQICGALGFKFTRSPHDDADLIGDIVRAEQATLGMISGARILKGSIIRLFAEGIVNFHPGPLPETAGLDSFYYAVKNGSDLGVTAHLIDEQMDAGHSLFFDRLIVKENDNPDSVLENIYQLQLESLRKVISLCRSGVFTHYPISQPSYHKPFSFEEKRDALACFDSWKEKQIISQQS